MFPIRVASNILVFGCIVLTAVICSILSVTSADDAISKTERNRDSSVDQCFNFTSEMMLKRTDDYLELLYNSINDALSKHFASQQANSEILLGEMLGASDEELSSWDYMWSKRSVVRNVYSAHRQRTGVAAAGMANKDTALLMLVEEGEDFDGGVLMHDALVISNGTSGFPPNTPVHYRTSWGSVEKYTGDFKVQDDYQMSPCVKWRDMPGVPMKPCFGDTDTIVAHDIQKYFGRFIPPGVENITFTPPVLLNPYIVVMALGTYYNSKGEYEGLTYVTTDIRQISQSIRRLNIPGKGRMYCLVKPGNWAGIDVDLHMTGTSHGNTDERNSTFATTLPAVESTDVIIRETATYIETNFADKYESLVDKEVIEIKIPAEEGGIPETFIVSVRTFDNGRQVNWYVVTALDREYILGDVDRMTNETKIEIGATSHEVSDDLAYGRLLLRVTITSVGVVMLLFGFFAITTVTKPIIVLKNEMASVAIMRLEDVDENRTLSNFTEVGEMQQSFLKMIANLKEYRNYIPQSALIESQSDDDRFSDIGTRSGITMSESSATSNSSNPAGDVANIKISYILKQRRVTIAVTNVINFSESNMTDHREYITKAFECCTSNGGIADGFSGDRFTMMFNGPRHCGTHSIQAVITCRSIIATSPYKVSAAVSTGSAKCGNMGCEGLKKFSVIGSLFSVAHALERVNRILDTKLVCCPIAERDISAEFYTRIEDQLWYPKFKKQTNLLIIFSILYEKKVAAEEWMYQLESCEAAHPTKVHNEIMELYFAELYDEALQRVSGKPELEDLKKKIEIAQRTKVNVIKTVSSELI
eukprot:TRINITY_DN500_c0_g3_i1.p1 TRINITY_DN500_c0_g3~~TRINITY_DN500_c0_g3_i1.p1  ORF type:complete len:816 (+),score=145.16 TRINITY_DN500_c0_g3_i1:127-2574(+)